MHTLSTAIVLNSESQTCIHKNLFIQLNIKHATCKIYKIKCLKVSNINGQKKQKSIYGLLFMMTGKVFTAARQRKFSAMQ